MTPEQLRDIAAQIMRHKSTVAVEGVVPQWLHDQLHAHADAMEKLKVLEEALNDERDAREDESGNEDEAIAGFAKQRMAAIDAALAAIREKP